MTRSVVSDGGDGFAQSFREAPSVSRQLKGRPLRSKLKPAAVRARVCTNISLMALTQSEQAQIDTYYNSPQSPSSIHAHQPILVPILNSGPPRPKLDKKFQQPKKDPPRFGRSHRSSPCRRGASPERLVSGGATSRPDVLGGCRILGR